MSEALRQLRKSEGFKPIHARHETIYLCFMKSRVDAAIDCYGRFLSFTLDSRQSETAILWLTHFLTHSAAFSRYMFPVPRNKNNNISNERAKYIREMLGVEEDSIWKKIEIRNFIEHFDEKLDVFLHENPGGFFVPFLVDEVNPQCQEDVNRGQFYHLLHYVNPEERYAVIANEKFDYGPIIEDLFRLKPIIDKKYIADRL